MKWFRTRLSPSRDSSFDAGTVGNLSELVERCHSLGTGKVRHIYRGQPFRYLLSTSLERACRRSAALRTFRESEASVIREFKRRYHHYAPHIPQLNHDLEWLSLMQHHGAPTRLLDWTYSLHVAAYFGVESAMATEDGDAAIWLLNDTWSTEATEGLLRKSGHDQAANYVGKGAKDYGDEDGFGPAFLRNLVSCACPVNPFRLNERLTLQKGVFMTVGDVAASFMDNLRALPGHDNQRNVARLRIPHNHLASVLEELHRMNITRATLFPGLDGFARSLDVNIESIPPAG